MRFRLAGSAAGFYDLAGMHLLDLIPKSNARIATLAINMRPVSGPWGGSSPFVAQLRKFLEGRGWRVQYRLDAAVDAVLLIDPREDLQSKAFGMRELTAFKTANPKTVIVHRINECDQRKGTAFMDDLLRKANGIADYTIFISEWLREYFCEHWFDATAPHSVVYNGADPAVFHPIGAKAWRSGEPFRIVTHHWSDNPLKGFDVYEELDRIMAAGGLPGVEFHVIGRWPKSIQWKAAQTFPPCAGRELADRLRQCHFYLTATRWEPCGMHHVEGAQCGLPLLYHEEGGGVVEAGKRYGLPIGGDLIHSIAEARAHYDELRGRVLLTAPSGDRMAYEYAAALTKLVAERRS